MSVVDYTRSLLDPFDTTFPQPKLFDGSVTRSSGLKFRQTGNITLDPAGADNFIVVFPGLSNGLAWKIGSGAWVTGAAYPTHLGTTTDRANVRKSRLVSSGLKLSLLNSSDDNEGYWEAIRVPVDQSLTLFDTTAPNGEDYRVRPGDGLFVTTYCTSPVYANYNTFQTGRLRDLHRFLFKLNSNAPDHPFRDILAATAAPSGANDCTDLYHDMVIIRLVGRIDAVTPTMLQYDFIANHEIVYKDDTVMSRLANINTMIPDLPVLLDKTRFILPAIQVA